MWTANAVCRLWGAGEHLLPFVLVDDVACALANAEKADGVVGSTFNLVGPALLTGRDYLAELEKAGRLKLDVRPTPIFAFYRADLLKWFVKVLVRHPERRFPSYRDWQSRSQRAIFDCRNAQRILGWVPCADRATLVREGIVAPVQEWLA